MAVNFDLIDEPKRLGIALNIYEAGGYENLATQQSQIAEQGPALPYGDVLSARISLLGLN